MSALTANLHREYFSPHQSDYAAIDQVQIFEGAALTLIAGQVQPLTSGDAFSGFALSPPNASRGVRIVTVSTKGKVELSVSGVVDDSSIGDTVYATDDNTFTVTPGGSEIGTICQSVNADRVVVEFDVGVSASGGGDLDIPVGTDGQLLGYNAGGELEALDAPLDVVAGDGFEVDTTTTLGSAILKSIPAVKPAVTVVATTNQALTGTPTIDGVATAAGSVILLTAQSTGAENGPWVAAAGAWARPTWYVTGSTTQAFAYITTFVRLGAVYQGSTWRMTTTGAITIGTTATVWVVTPLALNASTVATLTHPTSTWAARGSGTAVGQIKRISDIGPTEGTLMVWGGTYWKLLYPATLFLDTTLYTASTLDTNENVLLSWLMPAGLLRCARKWDVFMVFAKDGTTNTEGSRFRIGTAATSGATSISVLSGGTFSASSRSGMFETHFTMTSATNLSVLANPNRTSSWSGAASATTEPQDVTISDVDANALYMVWSTTMNGASDHGQLQQVIVHAWP